MDSCFPILDCQLEMPLELSFFHLNVGAGPTEKNVKANSAPIKTMILLIVGVSRKMWGKYENGLGMLGQCPMC